MSFKLLVAPVALAALAGCTQLHPVSLSPDPGFGEAIKYDMAIQTVDPDPVYDADGAQPGDHGEVQAKAVDRYRKGAVRQVQEESTASGPR